jgi:hypothetical protein
LTAKLSLEVFRGSSSARFGKGGYAYLIDKNGKVIAPPDLTTASQSGQFS